ncbi:hypothetical protein M0R45_022758 [Rubus argutus]|uniref:ATP-dependent RNA helicase n=1 Tax=Rubus argutus TaxID=59490 RepID=A0AAW1XIL3_RUBAR
MRKPISKTTRKQKLVSEVDEIKLLNSWIESQKPDCGSNPMSLPPIPSKAPIGRVDSESFSRYAGATRFRELPISKKTKDALRRSKYTDMTDIQRACLPHALCGRDILGAAKTGSGKTLAFVIPLLENLYKERWNPEDGVGSIIISPTRELASQTFDVLKAVGRHHNFSAGLLIGGRKDVETEKERVTELNILVCTPGRLLQHMDETPNFECSQLQLPKRRQTFLFSATQTKSVQDLARLSLKDPEYLSVHEKATRATPNRLKQTAMIVPLDKKLDMLWSFIKAHLNSRILVFLSTRKQVKFVYEAFKKLRPGLPLKCLHGKMKQEGRMGTYSQFHEKATVLFSTDVASRGPDFQPGSRLGCSGGLSRRYAAKIPIESIKANNKRLQSVSGLLSSLLVKYPDTLPGLAKRAFITYLKSIQNHKDKEVFDVMQLPVDEFSASMGLPMTPKIRFSNHKMKSKKPLELSPIVETDSSDMRMHWRTPKEELDIGDLEEEEVERKILCQQLGF